MASSCPIAPPTLVKQENYPGRYFLQQTFRQEQQARRKEGHPLGISAALEDEDGCTPSTAEMTDIHCHVRDVVQSHFGLIPAINFKDAATAIRNQAINDLERLVPRLQLCAGHWKARTLLGSRVSEVNRVREGSRRPLSVGAVAGSKRGRIAGVERAGTEGPANGEKDLTPHRSDAAVLQKRMRLARGRSSIEVRRTHAASVSTDSFACRQALSGPRLGEPCPADAGASNRAVADVQGLDDQAQSDHMVGPCLEGSDSVAMAAVAGTRDGSIGMVRGSDTLFTLRLH